MNRKSSSSNNLMRVLGFLVFMVIIAMNAFDDPSLQRFIMPLIVLAVVGISVLRMVTRLAGKGSSGGSMSSDSSRIVTAVMVMIGLVGVGAAFYFMMGRSGGSAPLPEVFRSAPLSGALEAVTQWGGLLVVAGLIGVVGAVVLTVFLRRGSELPGSSNRDPAPWDQDKPS